MGLLLERRVMPCRHSRLPSYLQECEYIESTGAEYINTEISCPNLTTDIDFQMVGSYSNIAYVASTWNFGSPNRYGVVGVNASGFMYDIENYNQALYNVPYDNEKHNVLFYTSNNHSIYMDSHIIAGSYDEISGTDIENVYLFASHGQRGAEFFSKSRIYYCKMVKDGTNIVREFIPCYRKDTNEAGFYDLVSQTFYRNANNAGAFIAGPDVN